MGNSLSLLRGSNFKPINDRSSDIEYYSSIGLSASACVMLWKITERQVVYILRKKRKIRSISRRVEKLPDGKKVSYEQNMDDYLRQTYGIKEEYFAHSLFRE